MAAGFVAPRARRQAIFVTGGSGFLGSHFLSRVRAFGRPVAFALVRGATPEAGAVKIAHALQAVAISSPAEVAPPDIIPVAGDIELPCCGIRAADLRRIERACVREVWHFAACLRFDDKDRRRIFAQNVVGTRNAVMLAAALDAARFVHVSTAFTAGMAEGLVRERLHPREAAFGNLYEASKCRAEHLAVEMCRKHRLRLTILRPSIVIGPSASKRSGGSQSGLYKAIHQLWRHRDRLAEAGLALRVTGKPHAVIDLIPVDMLMRDIGRLIAGDFRHGDIVHLCAAGGPTAQGVLSAICAALDMPDIEIVDGRFAAHPLAQRLMRRMQFYHSYVRVDRRFERTLPGAPVVSDGDLALFVAEAVRELASANGAPTAGAIRAPGGRELRYLGG